MRQAWITRKPTRATKRVDQKEAEREKKGGDPQQAVVNEKAGAPRTARRPEFGRRRLQPEISPLALDVAAA